AKKTGRKISGAGTFRDAVQSTRNKVVYAWGLNVVLLTLPVHAPWGGEPLGLPINMRIHRKRSGKTTLDLVAEMIKELVEWFPDREFHLCGDGAYAPLAGRKLPRTHVTSRLRRDAALYELPAPRRKGQRGRPAKKGRRLPPLAEIANALAPEEWTLTPVEVRGTVRQLLLYTCRVLWYEVLPDHQI
ncbi:MAG: transposase, partial [Acetobacteraceae bacterium]